MPTNAPPLSAIRPSKAPPDARPCAAQIVRRARYHQRAADIFRHLQDRSMDRLGVVGRRDADHHPVGRSRTSHCRRRAAASRKKPLQRILLPLRRVETSICSGPDRSLVHLLQVASWLEPYPVAALESQPLPGLGRRGNLQRQRVKHRADTADLDRRLILQVRGHHKGCLPIRRGRCRPWPRRS